MCALTFVFTTLFLSVPLFAQFCVWLRGVHCANLLSFLFGCEQCIEQICSVVFSLVAKSALCKYVFVFCLVARSALCKLAQFSVRLRAVHCANLLDYFQFSCKECIVQSMRLCFVWL